MPPRVRIIHVEGNIGVGKSKLLQHVLEALRVRIVAREPRALVVAVQEPVDAFVDVRAGLAEDLPIVRAVPTGDVNMLARMYTGAPGSAALFQFMALTARVMACRRALDEALAAADGDVTSVYLVCERSVDTDRHAFAEKLAEDGRIDATELCAYHRLYRDWRSLLPPCQHLAVIYVRASPATCFARVRERARGAESGVTLGYLEDLHARHERLYGAAPTAFGAPVLVLDDLGDVRVSALVVASAAARIDAFLVAAQASADAVDALSGVPEKNAQEKSAPQVHSVTGPIVVVAGAGMSAATIAHIEAMLREKFAPGATATLMRIEPGQAGTIELPGQAKSHYSGALREAIERADAD